MTCGPCRKRFGTWRQFARHCADVHQINPLNLARRYEQLKDPVDVILIQSAAGHYFLFGQGALL